MQYNKNREATCLERVEYADFCCTFKEMWGTGVKIAMDNHALRRAGKRQEMLVSFNTVANAVADLLKSDRIESLIMDLDMGSRFAILEEETGFTAFCSVDWHEATGMSVVFVHSIFVYDPIICPAIFVEPRCIGRYKIKRNGIVVVNPKEMVTNPKYL